MTERASVVVIGAGFGGLGAALTLAERDIDVVLCEALSYPGGCASTFRRNGLDWEAGATMFAGFAEGQLFRRWVDRYQLPTRTLSHDPVMHVRLGSLDLEVPASREAWAKRLASLPGAPTEGIQSFFAEQGRMADALWGLLDEPDLLPPLDGPSLLTHARRAGRYARIARWVGRPLTELAAAHGVDRFAPLMAWLDAACQITVQTSAARAEAPFAVGALDFLFRGVSSVDGGIGSFAGDLLRAIELAGGRVRMSDSVGRVEPDGSGWIVHARRAPIRCDAVVANVLPQVAARWLGQPVAADLTASLEAGWGACVLYLGLRDDPAWPAHGFHRQVLADPDSEAIEGNHALISVGRAQLRGGRPIRPATVSTHVRLGHHAEERWPEVVAEIQDRLRARVREVLPEARTEVEMTASPRTFARFTGRPRGLVGGVPRTVGLEHYREMLVPPHLPGLWLVGDSVFPGQSALASAIGGQRVAERVLRSGALEAAPRAAK